MSEPALRETVLMREAEALGLGEHNARVLALLPLVERAWSAGVVSAPEREVFLRHARAGFELEEPAWPILTAWLNEPPSPGYLVRGRNLIIALTRRQRGVWVAPTTKDELIELCRTVSRGILGLYGRRRLARAEVEGLTEIAALLVTRPGPLWSTLDARPAEEPTTGQEDDLDPPTDVGVPRPPSQVRPPNRAPVRIGGPRATSARLTRTDAGIEIQIPGGSEISIGRTRGNTFQILDDGEISRHHCRLFERDGAWFIEDLQSMNGTRVGGASISLCQLFGGEEILIGKGVFRFVLNRG